MPNPYLTLMLAAQAHAKANGAPTPVLAPNDTTLPEVDIPALHAAGFRVIPWTTNSPAKMRTLIALGVDGITTDRPDILQAILKQNSPPSFEVVGHRGARGLRPENTLPSFEAALDNFVTTLETDVGITTDQVALINHDQFFNPQCCRHADTTPYTLESRIYIRDITLAEAQHTFICDKFHPNFPNQKNDLALSPASKAFAEHESLPTPYTPIQIDQLFRFTRFYADFYRTGPGNPHPNANARATNADKVRFSIETKILPLPNDPERATAANPPTPTDEAEPTTNHTFDPQTFITTLHKAIQANQMEHRTNILSFDFRTLILAEEQLPTIPTFYLTESTKSLTTELIPPTLRQPQI